MAHEYISDQPTVLLDDEGGIDACWDSLHERLYSEAVRIEVPDAATVGDLLRALNSAWRLPPPYRVWASGSGCEYLELYDPARNRTIFTGAKQLSRTRGIDGAAASDAALASHLRDLGVDDGDDIEVIVQREYWTALPSLASRVSMRDLRAHLTTWENGVRGANAERRQGAPFKELSIRDGLQAVLLYTEEDRELAAYVRRHYLALHDLSGPHLTINLFERPVGPAGVRYWRDVLAERFFRLCCSLGWVSSVPYDLHSSYAAADYLGVPRAHLPCLVIFDSVARQEKVVIPMSPISPRMMRTVLSGIDDLLGREFRAMGYPAVEDGEDWRERLFWRREMAQNEVRRACDSLLTTVRSQASPVPNAYTFVGQTVFITNSQNTTIADFQNISPPD